MFFSFVMIMFQMVFVCVCAVILFLIVKNISTWNKNNHSPRLTVPATVVTKRTQVTQQQHANAGDPTGAHGFSTTTSTSYYVTLQVESGDRMELRCFPNKKILRNSPCLPACKQKNIATRLRDTT